MVSASGSVSEGISHWVDEHAKEEVKKLDSYLEDTRHVLDVIREENSRGPQPPGTIPVTLDIGGIIQMYLLNRACMVTTPFKYTEKNVKQKSLALVQRNN